MRKTKSYKKSMLDNYELIKIAVPCFDSMQEALGKAIKEYNESNQKLKILDLGCGNGFTSLQILKQNKNAKVTGVDISSIMIRKANKFLKNYRKRAKFVQDDAAGYLHKTPAGSVDVIASGLFLHGLPKNKRAELLQEIHRALKPGGLFVNADKYSPKNRKKLMQSVNYNLKAFDLFEKKGRPDLKKEWTNHVLREIKGDTIMFFDDAKKQMAGFGFCKIKQTFKKEFFRVVAARKSQSF